MMRQLLVERGPQGLEAALTEGRELTDYRVFPDHGILPEQVYLARTERIARGMGAAFMRLTGDQMGYLPFAEAKGPLQNGQAALVQVRKGPTGEKAAYLTQDISLPGKYLILLPFSQRRAVSSRLSDPAQKERLLALAGRIAPENMGVIMRRESAGADETLIVSELKGLLLLFEELRLAQTARAPALLWEGRSPLCQLMDDWPQAERAAVQEEGLLKDVSSIQGEVCEHPFCLVNVREQLRRLCARRVWLPSGGFLVVDLCEAMTVIDVNSGKDAGSGKDQETLFLRTNLEAVRTIARILRVRGLGGIILIDLIDMRDNSSKTRVEEALREAVQQDPVKCVVHGYTRLGLMEMTRKKTQSPVPSPAFLPCPRCGGTGLMEGNTDDTENH